MSIGRFFLFGGEGGEHFGAGQAGGRVAPHWCQLVEGLEEEAAFRQVRVGERQLLRVNHHVVGRHDVDVEHAVGVAAVCVAVGGGVEARLNLLYVGQNLGGCAVGDNHDSKVGESVGGNESPWARLYDARCFEISIFLLQGTQSSADVELDVAEIGSYVKKIVHGSKVYCQGISMRQAPTRGREDACRYVSVYSG